MPLGCAEPQLCVPARPMRAGALEFVSAVRTSPVCLCSWVAVCSRPARMPGVRRRGHRGDATQRTELDDRLTLLGCMRTLELSTEPCLTRRGRNKWNVKQGTLRHQRNTERHTLHDATLTNATQNQQTQTQQILAGPVHLRDALPRARDAFTTTQHAFERKRCSRDAVQIGCTAQLLRTRPGQTHAPTQVTGAADTQGRQHSGTVAHRVSSLTRAD